MQAVTFRQEHIGPCPSRLPRSRQLDGNAASWHCNRISEPLKWSTIKCKSTFALDARLDCVVSASEQTTTASAAEQQADTTEATRVIRKALPPPPAYAPKLALQHTDGAAPSAALRPIPAKVAEGSQSSCSPSPPGGSPGHSGVQQSTRPRERPPLCHFATVSSLSDAQDTDVISPEEKYIDSVGCPDDVADVTSPSSKDHGGMNFDGPGPTPLDTDGHRTTLSGFFCGLLHNRHRSGQIQETDSAAETLQHSPCRRCKGKQHVGLLGPRGFGLVKRRCRSCCRRARDTMSSRAPDIKDRLSSPGVVAVAGISCGASAAACVAVGAAAEVANLMPIFGRAVAAASSVYQTVRRLRIAEQWTGSLTAYIEATATVLERLRSVVHGDEKESCAILLKPLEQIGILLERLDVLVTRYAARGALAKGFDERTFTEHREEIVAALVLWNSNLTQGLQILHQDTLASVVGDLKTLARVSSGCSRNHGGTAPSSGDRGVCPA